MARAVRASKAPTATPPNTAAAKATAKASDARRAAINDNWAKLHPEAAKAEMALRQQRRRIRKHHSHSVNATPETHHHVARVQQGALARLYRAGDLSIDELARACEIAATAEALGAGVRVGGMSLEARVDNGGRGERFFESLGAVRREVAYTRWRAELPQLDPKVPARAVVLALIVDDVGVRAAAQRGRMRDCRAKALLHQSIELWGRLMGETAKQIDAATLLAAQAGLG